MALPILPPSATSAPRPRHLTPEALTPSSFVTFGTAISPPFATTLTTPPKTIPSPLDSTQPKAVFANQNSALKTSPVSQFANNYASSPSNRPSTPQMSMFSCFPRNLSGVGIAKSPSGEVVFRVEILERHPYTTQTFAPLGLARDDPTTVFLVVVAPSLPGSIIAALPDGTSRSIASPPDLSRLRAFIAKGDQAVTYGPGTWHAPMVVLGRKRVDFLVTQFVNDVAEDDCQEVLLGKNGVSVELKNLGLEAGMAERPKL
ncbi:hypothetical protein H2200_001106 [Cladophialophora chaetospira]|uniref:Ureidoglycolate hydrolase n=1 Tax=Cladophialophora chaetospira TaxID=386627 RepID=A0AA38XK92_9EURO|nr:hypothetical protein H2200_001106 [Cladophialophora chaetospira]